MKKRIVKFILFKIAETAAGIGYVIGSFEFWSWRGFFINDSKEESIVLQYICASVITFICAIGITLIVGGFVLLIKKNWEWAE